MSDAKTNAAIWYADDGYDPESKGVNGRRVAGASFLKGYFRHAEVSEFVSLTQGSKGQSAFAKTLKASGRDVPHRAVFTNAPQRMAPLGTLYFPAPNYADECWLRQSFGMGAYSICGITHTTSTRAVMQGILNLRAGPQAEWDAIICTSRAVHAATTRNMDLADEHLKTRFGMVPPRPQMPVIPLGINCDEFASNAGAAQTLRQRMGWSEDDIVIATLSRLLPYGKFDPGPLFIALQQAQTQLTSQRLHFLACGIYADTHSSNTFESCAKAFMPDVSYTHLDGADATARRETLSGADMFTFPIDNIQETFGLAPIEAMAAGLPVVTSDWDGMRDTVTADVGIRVPTLSGAARHTAPEAWRYFCGRQTSAQYSGNTSSMVAIDIAALSQAFVDLAKNPNLRQRMGRAALTRARTEYDWSVIIPKMQAFWGELSDRRSRLAGEAIPPGPVPMAPSPMDLFSSYPTEQFDTPNCRIFAVDNALSVADIYTARRYKNLGQVFEKQETLERVHSALQTFGSDGATPLELAKFANINPLTTDRCCLFLIKYGLARYARD